MTYESCAKKYSSYFSPLIKKLFQEDHLPIPFILELLEENCDDITCKHHVLFLYKKISQINGFLDKCRGCMCLLKIGQQEPTVKEISEVLGVTKQAIDKTLLRGLRRLKDRAQFLLEHYE